MSEQTEQVIVLQDGEGAYYAVPVSVIAGCRVPQEHQAEIAALVAGDGEVQGYALNAYLTFTPAPGVKPPANPLSVTGVFEIQSFSFGVQQPLNIGSQSSGSGAGKVTFNPFS